MKWRRNELEIITGKKKRKKIEWKWKKTKNEEKKKHQKEKQQKLKITKKFRFEERTVDQLFVAMLSQNTSLTAIKIILYLNIISIQEKATIVQK